MYTTSQFALKWSDFSEHLIGSYRNATEDTEFCDVTLVCEDDQQMEAHKVILAAASSVFESMLKRSKHPHPLVFMKGIKIEDLSAILNFIYIGQTNIEQDNIGKFLTLAESLKVKGLETKANPKENINPEVDSHKLFQEHENDNLTTVGEIYMDKSFYEGQETRYEDTMIIESNQDDELLEESLIEQEDRKSIYNMLEKTQKDKTETMKFQHSSSCTKCSKIFKSRKAAKRHKCNKHVRKQRDCIIPSMDKYMIDDEVASRMEKVGDDNSCWRCKVCGKESTHGHTLEHVRIHLERLTYSCAMCAFVCISYSVMRIHSYKHFRNSD